MAPTLKADEVLGRRRQKLHFVDSWAEMTRGERVTNDLGTSGDPLRKIGVGDF
jgi:hypothetical protein